MSAQLNYTKRILVIDFCNYEDYQIGGHLTFAKNLLSAFKSNLTLVGITTDKDDPVGSWFRKTIEDVTFDYFALAMYNKSRSRHIIPDRLACFLLLKYYRKRILRIGLQNVFVQRHEILPAIKNFKFKNICYRFPGLESPLSISKYWFGKYISNQFNNLFFSNLKFAKLILATGDEDSIEAMIIRSKGAILKSSVIQFPTRINTDIFKLMDKIEARKELNISKSHFIVTTTGRLSWFKGWKFMIDSFVLFKKCVPNSFFYIIGEGEDLEKIKEYIAVNNISDTVILLGGRRPEEISHFLNASNLFIMGSYKEGWSTSLSEAIACGIPSCVTNFSSAKEIILEGKNGYVIDEHDIDQFVQGMLKSMEISEPVFNDNVLVYSTNKLKDDLLNIWKLL